MKESKIKTTIVIDKALKKLGQVYAIQHDISFCELVEKALGEFLLKR